MPWTRVVKIKERVRNASSKMEMEGCIYHFSEQRGFHFKRRALQPFATSQGVCFEKK